MINMELEKIHMDILKLTDTEVIQRVLSGDTGLFEIIIRRYNPVLYKTGRAYGFNHQDIEDLMQETYIRAYQNLSGFENRSAFKTWLIRIMLNLSFHKMRKYSFRNEKATGLHGYLHSPVLFMTNNHSDTSRSVINKELSHTIEMALDKLPRDYKMTFTLRELAGLNVAETADLLGTSATNIKARLSRAKLMLRNEIEKTYSPEDIYEFNLIYCDQIVDRVIYRIKNRSRLT
jgi:RNA polymerase sigma factor (sigma-70 family)